LSAFKEKPENPVGVGVSRSGLPALGEYWPERGEERRDAAERRHHILSVARSLFDQSGVERVSMHEIARTAGVGQGTLYRRFEHKGALCSELLYESIRRFSEGFRERVEEGGLSGGTALEGLSELLAGIVRFNEENAALLGAIRTSGGERDPAAQYRGPFYRWLRAVVATLLSRAVEGGEIPDVDTESLPDAILAPLNIDLYLFQRHDLGLEPDHILRSLQTLLLDGLRGEGG
jgi:AcrR family transcriptional regulator